MLPEQASCISVAYYQPTSAAANIIIKNNLLIAVGAHNSLTQRVSGYRCVSDCRSRGREFDPGPVPYFRGD